jgi:hypothetical protein
MGAAISLIYVAGVLGTIVVQRQRAELTQSGRLSGETILTSLPWFVTSVAKLVSWPVVLVVWYAQGKPPSPWEAVARKGGGLSVRRVQRSSQRVPNGDSPSSTQED